LLLRQSTIHDNVPATVPHAEDTANKNNLIDFIKFDTSIGKSLLVSVERALMRGATRASNCDRMTMELVCLMKGLISV